MRKWKIAERSDARKTLHRSTTSFTVSKLLKIQFWEYKNISNPVEFSEAEYGRLEDVICASKLFNL